MEKHFKDYEDYLAFLELIEKQLSSITFDGKRKLTCSRMHSGATLVEITKNEKYTMSLSRTAKATQW